MACLKHGVLLLQPAVNMCPEELADIFTAEQSWKPHRDAMAQTSLYHGRQGTGMSHALRQPLILRSYYEGNYYASSTRNIFRFTMLTHSTIVSNRGVRLHLIADFKQYYFNSIQQYSTVFRKPHVLLIMWGMYHDDSDWVDKNTLEISNTTLTNTTVSGVSTPNLPTNIVPTNIA